MFRTIAASLVMVLCCACPTLGDEPSVEEVLRAAVERAACVRAEGLERLADLEMWSLTEKLDAQDQVRSVDEKIYTLIPLGDAVYVRLVERNGRPLSARERRQEANEESRFREQLASGEELDDGEEIVFDSALIQRFATTLEGVERIGGRDSYRVAFVPGNGDQPVVNRIDRAMNRSRGRLWIDRESAEIAAVEFELVERVTVWWGILGSISTLSGRFSQVPTEEGYWIPDTLDIQIQARILFRSVNETYRLRWRRLP